MSDGDLECPVSLFLSSPSLSTQPLVLSLVYAFLEAFLAIWALVRLCFLANFRFFKNLGSQPENVRIRFFSRKSTIFPELIILIRGGAGRKSNKTHEITTSQAIPQSKEKSFLTSFIILGELKDIQIPNVFDFLVMLRKANEKEKKIFDQY